VSVPNQVVNSGLMSIFAVSAKNVWAVGYSGHGIGVNNKAFILRWGGAQWRVVA
jgi:hypothetical protein